jgi:hypothetical protein
MPSPQRSPGCHICDGHMVTVGVLQHRRLNTRFAGVQFLFFFLFDCCWSVAASGTQRIPSLKSQIQLGVDCNSVVAASPRTSISMLLAPKRAAFLSLAITEPSAVALPASCSTRRGGMAPPAGRVLFQYMRGYSCDQCKSLPLGCY